MAKGFKIYQIMFREFLEVLAIVMKSTLSSIEMLKHFSPNQILKYDCNV